MSTSSVLYRIGDRISFNLYTIHTVSTCFGDVGKKNKTKYHLAAVVLNSLFLVFITNSLVEISLNFYLFELAYNAILKDTSRVIL